MNQSNTMKKPSHAILYALMFGPFFSMFDSGLVNVGLPVIAKDFGTGMQAVQWVASVYLLTMSALLPILGSIADRLVRGRIYNLGFFTISIFTLLCGFAPDLPVLILFRTLQAIGGAMVMANGMAIATESYPPSERGKNLGMLASMPWPSEASPVPRSAASLSEPGAGARPSTSPSWSPSLPSLTTFFTIPKTKKGGADMPAFRYRGGDVARRSDLQLRLRFLGLGEAGHRVGPARISRYSFSWLRFRLSSLSSVARLSRVFDTSLFRSPVFSSSLGSSLISFATMYSPTVLVPFYLQGTLGAVADGWTLPFGLPRRDGHPLALVG